MKPDGIQPSRRIAAAAGALLAFGAGFAVRGLAHTAEPDGSFVQRRAGSVRLTNPLLECDVADDVLRNRQLTPLKARIAAAIAQEGRTDVNVAVYFRALNEAIWFSIGEGEKYDPASLTKVPAMIALLKKADREGAERVLERRVRNDLGPDYNQVQTFDLARKLERGREYTVGELIWRMIALSDNNAAALLLRELDPEELQRVYSLLRMQNPGAVEDDEYLSVQTYASFFRILYNSTYLSPDASEWALETLAQSQFKAGLVAGVPPEVRVAHKFGEAGRVGAVQRHDCGIVYYPERPYLLCVMSRGPTYERLDGMIRLVSRLVYEEIDAQHRNVARR